jgi:hypothetical protein
MGNAMDKSELFGRMGNHLKLILEMEKQIVKKLDFIRAERKNMKLILFMENSKG